MGELTSSFADEDNGFQAGQNSAETDGLRSGAGVVEISGAIKWFDVSKGYGFIVPDQKGQTDVLLHVTCLRRDGFQVRIIVS